MSEQLSLRTATAPPQIGEQIGVGAVIEGSVRKSGNRLRVTVQVVNVETGSHLLSESYDRRGPALAPTHYFAARVVIEWFQSPASRRREGASKVNVRLSSGIALVAIAT